MNVKSAFTSFISASRRTAKYPPGTVHAWRKGQAESGRQIKLSCAPNGGTYGLSSRCRVAVLRDRIMIPRSRERKCLRNDWQ